MSEEKLQAAAEDSFVIENDEVETPSTEPQQETTPEESGSAPDTGENQEEEIKFDEKQQAKINDIVAKKTFKQREAEREAERLRQELEEIRKQVPQQTRPDIPPIPDRYDDQYEQKLKARDEAIQKAVAFDMAERVRSEQRVQSERETMRRQQEAFNQAVTSYTDRAEKLGVTKAELEQAGKLVASYNIPDMVAAFVLDDDQGPLITKYLSRNPLELEQLKSLPPHQAIAHLATAIKPKASGLKPKPNLPPEPTETLKGLGAREKERGPEGATFE